MERFNEFNKKNTETAKTNEKDFFCNESIKEKKETEDIQNEEKKFFRKVTESAKYFFHIAPKENFKKVLRVVALATILSAPIGEKSFAEREVNAKESTVAVVVEQEDKEEGESYKKFLESQKEYFESFSDIAEQKRLLKEKYKNVDIVDIPNVYTFEEQKKMQEKYGLDSNNFGATYGSEYSGEELKEFDEALEKVQKFAPKQFSELKIVLKKVENNLLFKMFAEPNLFKNLDNFILNTKINEDNMSLLISALPLQRRLAESEVEMQKIRPEIKNSDSNFCYDVIFSIDREAMIMLTPGILDEENEEEKNKIETGYVPYTDGLKEKNIYKNASIHELCHLIALNNPNACKELVNKFDEINKKVDGSSMITHPISSIVDLNIIRYSGFVSTYAGANNTDAIGSGHSDKYNNKIAKIDEDIAETMTYMINDHHYADDDTIVQEKIKVIREFLNKK